MESEPLSVQKWAFSHNSAFPMAHRLVLETWQFTLSKCYCKGDTAEGAQVALLICHQVAV